MQGLHLHFDLPAGAAGDMILGSLLDLGVPVAVVQAALAQVPLGGGYVLSVTKTERRGIVGTDFKVVEDQVERQEESAPSKERDQEEEDGHGDYDGGDGYRLGHHGHRRYGEIRRMLGSCTLEQKVRELALAVFDRLAGAEGKLHGVSAEDVAFHEVGALDSIVDIVGTAAAIGWLAPTSVSATPVPLGHGTTRCAHGLLPVPAPAVLEILKDAGAPVFDGGVEREICTPTGAAILAAVVRRWGPMPSLYPERIGYGAGDWSLPDRPNMVRALLGRPTRGAGGEEPVFQVETNIDDMPAELCEHVADRLFATGALDVWFTPIVMKKCRPAFVLSALCSAQNLEAACSVITTETTTLGLRIASLERRTLDRTIEIVSTDYGPVEVKVATRAGTIVNVAPEYESCRQAALTRGVPLKDVYAAAASAFRSRMATSRST
ncbi:MAG: nickel pincer cofactor biosynthesis protein LarC [Pseudomonadota bacterium]